MIEYRFNEDARPAFQPWQQSARMGGAVEAWRARSVASAQALADAQGEKARSAGLVSLSTTCKGVSVVDFFTENTIEIEHQKTRLTRMRKALGVSAKCLHNQGPKNQRVWMLTLTYAGTNRDWRPEHISRFLDGLRKWHYSRTGEKKVRYAWVAELQRRGVIHYHVVVWLDAGLTPPKPDRAWRARGVWQAPMWTHGMSNRVEAYAPVAYLMKYATKDVSKIQGGSRMGHEFMGQGAWMSLAVVAVAGYFGLRMCRAMLRSQTAFDLQRAAATSMLKPVSFSCLNSHQQAAVFLALCASGIRQGASKQMGHFAGSSLIFGSGKTPRKL